MAGQRMDSNWERDLNLKRRESVPVVRNLLVRAWSALAEDLGPEGWRRQGHGQHNPLTWREIQSRLPLEVLDFGELAGIEVESWSGERLWRSAGLGERGGPDLGRSAPFLFPDNVSPEEAARVWVVLDVEALTAERQDLTNFVVFGVCAIAAGMYVLAAVVIILDRAQTRLSRAEHDKSIRLRAIGEVAGGIAHEVRNPLNAISLSVQYMQKLGERDKGTPSPKDYARIHLELGKIRKVVDSFVRFARLRDLVVGPVDTAVAMTEALQTFTGELESRAVRISRKDEGDVTCAGDKDKIVEVFTAVLRNAIDSMEEMEGGELGIRLSGRGRMVRIVVRDTGQVMGPEDLTSIFEPSFAARDTAMGLGMTVARTFVEAHGGAISASPAQGGGCVVTIDLPRKGFG